MPLISIPENYQRYLVFGNYFLIAIATAFLFSPIVGYIARKFNAIDYHYQRSGKISDLRRLIKPPQALWGGIAVLIPLIIYSVLFTPITASLVYFIIAITLLMVMGMVDDKSDMPGTRQYIFQIIAAFIIFLSPINITGINDPFNGAWNLNHWFLSANIGIVPVEIALPGDLLWFVWIPVCINALKFSSGTDGALEGNTIVSSIILFLLSVRFNLQQSAVISILFAGLLLGFLYFNFPPAKLRSGSPGKSTYGLILAVLSVMIGGKIATAIIILMLPLADFVRVLIGRIIKHHPRSIKELLSISDQTHIHHKLMEFGLSERQVALVEYTISIALGALALAYSGAYRALFFFIALLIVLCVLIAVNFFRRSAAKKPVQPPDTQTPEARYSY